MVRTSLIGLIILALAAITWCGITIMWQEPVTGAIHARQQRASKRELQNAYRNARIPGAETSSSEAGSLPTTGSSPRTVARSGVFPELHEGQVLGTLRARNIDTMVVYGRSAGSLKKAPGMWNARPGQGKTVVISGHRSTYGAPFRHIDTLAKNDVLRLATPWGTWRYRVYAHAIVKPTDVWVAKDRGDEQLVLTSCHPVHSSESRYVVFAKLVRSKH